MASIAISELRPSFLAEMETAEVNNVVGGFIGDFPASNGAGLVGVPNPGSAIIFKPAGGNIANTQEALGLAIEYGGFDGFVFEGVFGGSFGFISYQRFFVPPDA